MLKLGISSNLSKTLDRVIVDAVKSGQTCLEHGILKKVFSCQTVTLKNLVKFVSYFRIVVTCMLKKS